MNSENTSIPIGRVIFIVRKHFKMLLSFGFLFLAVGFIGFKYCIPPKYEANVKLVVTAGLSSQTAVLTYDQLSTAQQLLNTCAVVLKSYSTLDEVIQKYKLPVTVEQLQNRIEIQGIDETEVLSITVKDSNAQTAAVIANAVASLAPAQLIKTVKAGSVEVISPAQVDNRPVSPNLPLYTLLSFAVGIILGILTAFLVEMLDDTFMTDSSVEEYLGVPVLGVIPHIKIK